MSTRPAEHRPLLLAVDDNHAHCYAVARLAHAAGFDVRQAFTGHSALRLVKIRPEAIVLDVHLPDIDGFEVCRRLKRDPATAHIPVVFCSATLELEEGSRVAAELGALAFLSDADAGVELEALLRRLIGA